MKLPLTVAMITYNEEENLPKTLEAIKDIASEIVIIDSHSKDKTVEIAKNYGARVFIEDWKGFREQKNSLIEKCTQKWILFLDADEVVSKELKKEIIEAIKKNKADGFILNRKTFYAGKFLNHVWQPDRVLRLVKKESNPRWEGGNVHEYLAIDGKVEKLNGYLFHYTYKNIYEHYQKSIKYAKLSAEEMYKSGKKFKIHKLLLNPTWAFIREYFIHMGFLDGIRGLTVAITTSYYKFAKYIFLWELEKNKQH
ncbi:glycosyltransferase family 2 protein [Desulfurobacterium atlanticum]|uniref:Glycosyltransferase involved in cell wall bisynthesis n=1 Tax=Desulfurobacterium atlanticum TaxID=240169 RepID=A0A238YVR8_9BACT|nr:glycosyltransferase family 2 protein [Desulfurobacterium atlanticum]SNR75386.1 Glycosyltransferase involved in cell wall bisynthesis [Desulfurobacterium atlanticum]